MREICASGSVGGEGGNALAYPAGDKQPIPQVAMAQTSIASKHRTKSSDPIHWQNSFPRQFIMYWATHRSTTRADIGQGERMSAICDVNLAMFCGRIGNLYVRHGLCPPFALHNAAQGWMAREIPPSHCIDVIERYLTRYGRSCPSGSGDRNFAWLNSLIQTTWYDRSYSRPWTSAKDTRRHDWLDEFGAEKPNQTPCRIAASPAGVPKLVSKADTFKPDRAGLRQKAASKFSPVMTSSSCSGQRSPRCRMHGYRRDSGG